MLYHSGKKAQNAVNICDYRAKTCRYMIKTAQNIEKKAEKTLKNACFSLKNGWYYVAYSGGIGWHTSTPDGYTKVQTKSTNVLLFIELSVTGIDRGVMFFNSETRTDRPTFPPILHA